MNLPLFSSLCFYICLSFWLQRSLYLATWRPFLISFVAKGKLPHSASLSLSTLQGFYETQVISVWETTDFNSDRKKSNTRSTYVLPQTVWLIFLILLKGWLNSLWFTQHPCVSQVRAWQPTWLLPHLHFPYLIGYSQFYYFSHHPVHSFCIHHLILSLFCLSPGPLQ